MMRVVLSIAALLALIGCSDFEDHEEQAVRRSLTIYSTTDISAFQPVLDDYRAAHPNVDIKYAELEAAELDARFRSELAQGRPVADLLLSSAMDLQVKLVNDGYAASHRSSNAAALPAWARWRDEALGFTFEPVVMVFNRELMRGRAIPTSRPELLAAIRSDPAFWHRRIGTYSPFTSSAGYLITSQDARQSSDYGGIVEAFRNSDVVTADTTSEILNQVDNATLALGYNVLGSYARAQAEKSRRLEIVYPSDYTLAVARTAVIPKSAPNAGMAHRFLEHLLSIRGQRLLADRSRLSAVRPEVDGPYSRLGITESSVGPLRPIALGPGLLVYLDRQKRERLLELWSGTPAP